MSALSTAGIKLDFKWFVRSKIWLISVKKVCRNFRKFISQEQQIKILIWDAYCLYFNLLFKLQISSHSKYDLRKLQLRVFEKKLRQLSFMVFSKIQIVRDLQKKARNKPILHHRKFGIPTARVLKISNLGLISFSE